ncbi:MAG: VCBS repeat-containing protein [Okeania sp. SIO2C9]|nr:VCBS repeat-containing protein [Okeania sp. SIO2C9]
MEEVVDFNSDGTPDILWRDHKTGNNRIWFMNSDGTRSSIQNPGWFNSNFQMEEVVDFNSDGTPDILWRNQEMGGNRIWFMNSDGTLNRSQNPGWFDSRWSVIGDDFSLV